MIVTRGTLWAFKPEIQLKYLSEHPDPSKAIKPATERPIEPVQNDGSRLGAAMAGAKAIKRFRSNHEPGFVYIIQCHDKFKIGSAIKPKERLSLLQTGCPYQLTIIRVIKVGNMLERERDLQRMMRQYRHAREWFTLPECAVRRLMVITDEDLVNRSESF